MTETLSPKHLTDSPSPNHFHHPHQKNHSADNWQQTEIGMIPADWKVASLDQLLGPLEAGISVNSVEKEKGIFAHDESILKTSCVLGGKFRPEEHKQILPSDLHRAKLNPRKDSIIFSRMNTPALVGECGYVDQDYKKLFMPDRLWMTQVNSSYSSCARWLAYLLSFGSMNRAIKDTATGTSGRMKNISKGSLLSVQIPIPPKAEQEAIADALSDADALIASLEQLIAKKRSLKQGAMQALLTGQQRLPGFEVKPGYQQTEVGLIPVDWEVKSLGNIAPIATGNTPPTENVDNYGDEFLFVSPADLGSNKYISRTEKMLSKKGFAISRHFPKNSILFVCIGSTIGKCGMASKLLTSNQQINAIFPSNDIFSDFVYYAVSLVAAKIRSLAGEQAVPIVNKTQFSETKIPLPPTKAEQEAIATILSDMDSEIGTLEAKLGKARQIKQGMMQELLTGRIRLV